MESQQRYQLENLLGSGAMGEVYQALDKRLGRKVAIKLLHKHLSGNKSAETRFENEARVIASINHPNIVNIFDIGKLDDRMFLSLELVDGLGLDKVLQHNVKLPNKINLNLFIQIFSGLGEAHAKGVLHRDIKPSNILLKRDGTVLLGDFGLAHAVFSPDQTQDQQLLGTPRYASPEAANTFKFSDRSDVFSAGSVLFECLYGSPAFPGETPHEILLQIMRAQPVYPSNGTYKVLPQWKPLLTALLDKNQENRPKAVDVVTKLEDISRELDIITNREGIANFLTDPEREIKNENQHLGTVFGEKAKLDYSRRKLSSAHRYEYLASAFLGKDLTLDSSGPVRKKVLSAAFMFFMTVLFLASLIVTVFLFPEPDKTVSDNSDVATRLSLPDTLSNKTPDSSEESLQHKVVVPLPEPEPVKVPATNPDNLSEFSLPESASDTLSLVKKSDSLETNSKPAEVPEPGKSYYWPKTSPPFSRVILDGKIVGQTPFSKPLEIRAGKHRVRFIKGGFYENIREFEIFPGDTSYDAIILKKLP